METKEKVEEGEACVNMEGERILPSGRKGFMKKMLNREMRKKDENKEGTEKKRRQRGKGEEKLIIPKTRQIEKNRNRGLRRKKAK